MSLGNFPDSFIVEDFLCVAPPAQRIPRFYDRTILPQILLQFLVLIKNMILVLHHGVDDFGNAADSLKII